MIYRLIESVHADKIKAESACKKLTGRCKNPKVVFSKNSSSWIVQLMETPDEHIARKAYSWYKSQGIDAALQKLEEK